MLRKIGNRVGHISGQVSTCLIIAESEESCDSWDLVLDEQVMQFDTVGGVHLIRYETSHENRWSSFERRFKFARWPQCLSHQFFVVIPLHGDFSHLSRSK